MPLLENFDAFRQAKVFNTLNLQYGYHQLSLKEGDKMKTSFWKIDPHGKDYLYQWTFLPFCLSKMFAKFQKVMDQTLMSFGFVKCYIDDIIFFNLTIRNHMQHLQQVFRIFKKHNLKFHLSKCWFFHIQVEYLNHRIYPGGQGVSKGQG